MNITVYQYLWDYKSDLIQTVKTLVPFMVPTENSGALYQVSSTIYPQPTHTPNAIN